MSISRAYNPPSFHDNTEPVVFLLLLRQQSGVGYAAAAAAGGGAAAGTAALTSSQHHQAAALIALMYVGPVIMSLGCVALIYAFVVFCEARDHAIQFYIRSKLYAGSARGPRHCRLPFRHHNVVDVIVNAARRRAQREARRLGLSLTAVEFPHGAGPRMSGSSSTRPSLNGMVFPVSSPRALGGSARPSLAGPRSSLTAVKSPVSSCSSAGVSRSLTPSLVGNLTSSPRPGPSLNVVMSRPSSPAARGRSGLSLTAVESPHSPTEEAASGVQRDDETVENQRQPTTLPVSDWLLSNGMLPCAGSASVLAEVDSDIATRLGQDGSADRLLSNGTLRELQPQHYANITSGGTSVDDDDQMEEFSVWNEMRGFGAEGHMAWTMDRQNAGEVTPLMSADNTSDDDSAPETDEPKTTAPEIAKPKISKPKTDQPETEKLETAEPEITTSKINQPEMAESKIFETETAKTKIVEPKIAKPKTVALKIVKPKINKSKTDQDQDTAEAEIFEPETTEQKIAKPKTVAAEPETNQPEAAKRETSAEPKTFSGLSSDEQSKVAASKSSRSSLSPTPAELCDIIREFMKQDEVITSQELKSGETVIRDMVEGYSLTQPDPTGPVDGPDPRPTLDRQTSPAEAVSQSLSTSSAFDFDDPRNLCPKKNSNEECDYLGSGDTFESVAFDTRSDTDLLVHKHDESHNNPGSSALESVVLDGRFIALGDRPGLLSGSPDESHSKPGSGVFEETAVLDGYFSCSRVLPGTNDEGKVRPNAFETATVLNVPERDNYDKGDVCSTSSSAFESSVLGVRSSPVTESYDDDASHPSSRAVETLVPDARSSSSDAGSHNKDDVCPSFRVFECPAVQDHGRSSAWAGSQVDAEDGWRGPRRSPPASAGTPAPPLSPAMERVSRKWKQHRREQETAARLHAGMHCPPPLPPPPTTSPAATPAARGAPARKHT